MQSTFQGLLLCDKCPQRDTVPLLRDKRRRLVQRDHTPEEPHPMFMFKNARQNKILIGCDAECLLAPYSIDYYPWYPRQDLFHLDGLRVYGNPNRLMVIDRHNDLVHNNLRTFDQVRLEQPHIHLRIFLILCRTYPHLLHYLTLCRDADLWPLVKHYRVMWSFKSLLEEVNNYNDHYYDFDMPKTRYTSQPLERVLQMYYEPCPQDDDDGDYCQVGDDFEDSYFSDDFCYDNDDNDQEDNDDNE